MKIGILGLGGGGSNAAAAAIKKISKNPKIFNSVEFLFANTDIDALDKLTRDLSAVKIDSSKYKKLVLGPLMLRGLGAGAEPYVGYVAMLESQSEIEKFFMGKDFVFMAVGLGGGTGSGAVVAATQIARNLGVTPIVFATTPWKFEGNEKYGVANRVLNSLLKQEGTGAISIVNNSVDSSIGQTIFSSFNEVDNMFVKTILSLLTIILETNATINIDINDIKYSLNKNTSSFFFFEQVKLLANPTQSAQNTKTILNACSKAMNNQKISIKKGGTIVVNISGSKAFLQMDMINDIMDFFNEETKKSSGAEKDDVFFGATFSDSYRHNVIVSGFITNIKFDSIEQNPLYTDITYEKAYGPQIIEANKKLTKILEKQKEDQAQQKEDQAQQKRSPKNNNSNRPNAGGQRPRPQPGENKE